MSFTKLLVPTFTQMLNAMSGWISKAELQLNESESKNLMSARLASDMFPLSTQVRFACVQAYEAVSRLKKEEFTEVRNALLEEGRNAADQPGTISDAQVRISQTITMLNALSETELDTETQSSLVHELPDGMTFDLTAEQYVRDWVIPQFYFHTMAAYAILRHEKIEVGKADYVAHMFQYVRPRT
ncbi:MAG: DUF1993 domain-containing protein [Pseudomonadota bacterium]